MRIHTLIAASEIGLAMDSGVARQLGLSDGAVCWGQWVCGRPGTVPDTKLGPVADDDPRRQGVHLVLSPVHPDLWAGLFIVQAQLNRDIQSPVRFVEQLTEAGVNILATEIAVAGYKHTTLTAFCTFASMESAILKELSSGVSDEVRKKQFRSIGCRMIGGLAGLEGRLRSNPSGCLSTRISSSGHTPWFLENAALGQTQAIASAYEAITGRSLFSDCESTVESLVEGKSPGDVADHGLSGLVDPSFFRDLSADQLLRFLLWRQWRFHWMEAVSCSAVLPLAYSRIWRHDVRPEPIRFSYDAGEGMLRAPASFVADLNELSVELGAEKFEGAFPATVALDVQQRFARVRFMRQQFCALRMYKVRVDYLAKHVSTQGLLAAVLRGLEDCNLETEALTDTLQEFGPNGERGSIVITARQITSPTSAWPHELRAVAMQRITRAVRDRFQGVRYVETDDASDLPSIRLIDVDVRQLRAPDGEAGRRRS
jgi:hypothetical protein